MTDSGKTALTDLTEEQCWELLGQKELGRLAVAIRNQPDIFPVNYVVDDQSIVIRTAPGLKLAAAELGMGVAFEVDAIDETAHTGWSIVARGPADEIENLEELLDTDRLHLEPWASGDKNRYLRITPTVVTGRQLPPAT